MTTAIYRGAWERYTPVDMPTEMHGMRLMYFRRPADGADLYAQRSDWLTDTAVTVSAELEEAGNYRIRSVSSSGMCAVPTEEAPHLFTVVGWSGEVEGLVRCLIDGATLAVATLSPTPVPLAVTRAQAMIQLYDAGLLDQVETLVAAHPYPPVRIWWTHALTFERSNAYLAAIATEIGLSDLDIDNLFIAAATRV